MVTDLLAKLATMGGSVPLAGAMASEMAFATDLEARPVVGPWSGGAGVPVVADGSPSAPRPDRVRPIPPEAVGSAVEAAGTDPSPGRSGEHGVDSETDEHSPEAGCDQNGGSNRPISPLASGTVVGGPASCPCEPHERCLTR